MDFERRAQKAYERGEPARAVVVLVEGLKSRPDREATGRLLVEYYTEGVESPGLERDVVEALVAHSEGERLASRIDEKLEASGREAMARDFRRAVEDRGLAVAHPSGKGPDPAARREVEEPADPPEESTEPSEDEDASAAQANADHRSNGTEAESEESAPVAGRRDSGPPSSVSESDGETTSRGSNTDLDSESFLGAVSRGFGLWRAAAAGLFILGLFAAGTWQWGWGVADARGTALGEYFRTVDPIRPDALERFDDWSNRVGVSEEVSEDGRAFLRAVRALEAGERHRNPPTPTSAWGESARAVSALTSDDLQEAVRIASRLERTRRSKSVVRFWTNARVAEYRGKLGRASRLYRKARETAPEFAPAVTGGLRVAYARLDSEAIRRLLERLRDIRSSHRYTILERIELPRVGLSEFAPEERRQEQSDGEGSASGEEDSAFLSALQRYASARDAAANRRFDRASRLASEVLEGRPSFGPALWVCAVSNAAKFELDRADKLFARLVALPVLAPPYRWYSVVVAPNMFTGAGRPDLGAKYVLPGFGSLETAPSGEASGSSADDGPVDAGSNTGSDPESTVTTRATRWTFQPANSSVSRAVVEEAHLGRLRVALELGQFQAAQRMLDELPEMRVRNDALALLRAELEARRGRRPAGPKDWQWEEAREEERVVDAYYAGRFETAIEIGTNLMSTDPRLGRAARIVALSYASTDQGRRALQTIADAETTVSTTPAAERVRSRILARLGGPDAEADDVFEKFEDFAPTSVEAAIDLAAVGLWLHDVDAADRWSRVAAARAPDHPEVNWMHGLALRMQGNRREAEPFFRRSWRARKNTPRLSLELGYVHLAERQYERARDLFYRALLADPGSLEAIRGLGRAYEGFDSSQGKWNFERILENYESKEERAVHAAEVLRWLAVFAGSRKGTDGSLEYLERARSLAGDRPRLLLEVGRYYEARGDLKEARRWYMEALEKDATLAPAHLGLAKVAGRRDNTRGKRTHLRRYLDLQPEGSGADWARDALRQLRELNSEGGD